MTTGKLLVINVEKKPSTCRSDTLVDAKGERLGLSNSATKRCLMRRRVHDVM
jgi:hypothetical protein